LYADVAKAFRTDRRGDAISGLILETCNDALRYLAKRERRSLISGVEGKEYFSFVGSKGKLSRPVNLALFDPGSDRLEVLFEALRRGSTSTMSPDDITSACYSAAIGFSCLVDLEKDGDQKTPGTFFEYLICHLVARRLGVDPKTRIEVLNLDKPTSLPTDWIFDLGVDQPKVHLPVKTSTRERVIQVWAHQRVLDGVYGAGRFLGTLVCLAETKLDHRTLEVVEICLPEQWKIYQMFIARMNRVYYLDVPRAYESLHEAFPRIHVHPFGRFFAEADNLGNGD